VNSLDINLFFPVGIPAGHDLIKAGITLEPKLMSLTPNDGTYAGTLITASVPGVGKDTTGLDLVQADGSTICQDSKITVVEYGKIQCWSNLSLTLAEPVDIKLKHGENTYDCSNADTTKCQYKQDNAEDTWPRITSLTKTDTTLVFTGVNFYTAGYIASASYLKIDATSVVIDSETQATATFEGGVPITTAIGQSRWDRANLLFQLQGTDQIYKSINTGDDIKNFVNPFALSDSSSGLSCSFNGGCELSMQGTAGVQTLFR